MHVFHNGSQKGRGETSTWLSVTVVETGQLLSTQQAQAVGQGLGLSSGSLDGERHGKPSPAWHQEAPGWLLSRWLHRDKADSDLENPVAGGWSPHGRSPVGGALGRGDPPTSQENSFAGGEREVSSTGLEPLCLQIC